MEQQEAHGRDEGNGVQAEASALEELDPGELMRAARAIAREHPHATIAGAFAAGFLLGGGLTPRLLVSLAVFAGRRYAAEAARVALNVALEEAGASREPT